MLQNGCKSEKHNRKKLKRQLEVNPEKSMTKSEKNIYS